jgi:prevent-host-death family protein
MGAMDVGVRELRGSLSKYLQTVQDGAEVTVTDHGRAIARIVPIGERPIDRLIREGIVTRAVSAVTSRPTPRIVASDTVSDLVSKQRG